MKPEGFSISATILLDWRRWTPVKTAALRRHHAGRQGKPGDVANTVVLLASGRAGFATG